MFDSDFRSELNNLPKDALKFGVEYLQMVRELALSPMMVDMMGAVSDASSWGSGGFENLFNCENAPIYTWIGKNIQEINATLNEYLNACHECFLDSDRPNIKIYAAPLASRFGIDGLCNIFVQPTTILIDVGRTHPHHWLGVVAHEYAHAYLQNPGHGEKFAQVLTHLCLGLGLEVPTWESETMEAWLCNYPHCQTNSDPLAFWQGK